MGVPPLSPPHSPAPGSSIRAEESGPLAPLTEAVFVSESLTVDALDGIDRAEMNRYLWPDQATMYSTSQGPSTSPAASPHPLSCSTTPSSVPSPLLSYHTSLQPPVPSTRMLGPPPLYSAPTYCSVSPVVPNSSPEAGEASNSSSSSPPPPSSELVELQPPRRDDPLPPLSSHKGVNPFFAANNLCYPQYSYNYSHPYASMWP